MEDTQDGATKEEITIAETLLQRVMSIFDVTGIIEIRRRREGTILDVQGCSNPGRMIGENGATLHAIQLLATLIICRNTKHPTDIIIDVNGYRSRRRNRLEDIAWDAFDRVMDTGRSVTLRPMNAADRRVIHMTLSECDEVETFSVDEDPETGEKRVEVAPRRFQYDDDEETDYDEEEELLDDDMEEEDWDQMEDDE